MFNEIIEKITQLANEAYPIALANLAEDIFASGGQSHGRDWAANKPRTIKNKGGNSPNIETGQLENWLSTPGNILDDNYMNQLPNLSGLSSNKKGINYLGYKYANVLRPFDDIGRTESDEEYVMQQVINSIIRNYNNG